MLFKLRMCCDHIPIDSRMRQSGILSIEVKLLRPSNALNAKIYTRSTCRTQSIALGPISKNHNMHDSDKHHLLLPLEASLTSETVLLRRLGL